MPRLLLALALLFAATAAKADDWRVLFRDSFVLVLLNANSGRATGSGNPSYEMWKFELYPTVDGPGAPQHTEEEVQCSEQRVRSRFSWAEDPTGRTSDNDQIDPWRDPGQELDRMLVDAICHSDVLNAAPLVRGASAREGGDAHFAFSKDMAKAAKEERFGKWRPAFEALHRASPATNVPTILAATHAKHRFVPIGAHQGGFRFLDVDAEKSSEQRYRYHEVVAGGSERADVAASWGFVEIDCGRRTVRVLAHVGFDVMGKELYGYDHHLIGGLVTPIEEGTTAEQAFNLICMGGRENLSNQAISSTLKEIIAANAAFYSPSLETILTGRPENPWREFYISSCGRTGCEPRKSVETTGRTALGLAAAGGIAALGFATRNRQRNKNGATSSEEASADES